MGWGKFIKKAKKSISRAGKKYGKVLKKASPKGVWDDTVGKIVHKVIPGAAPYIEAGGQLGTSALLGSLGVPPQLTSAALALDHATNTQVAQPLGRAPGELPAGVNNSAAMPNESPGFSIPPVWIAAGIAGAAALLLLERRR